MNIKSFTGAVSLAALIGGTVIGPANAQLIVLGLQEAGVNGGALTTIGSASAYAGYDSGIFSYGAFNITAGTAQGEANNSDGFTSNFLAVIKEKQSTQSVLDVYFTEQGLTGTLAPAAFVSGLTSNSLSKGWKVTETIYIDPANGLFTTVNPVATYLFSKAGGDAANFTDTVSGLTTYSVTEVYHIVAPGDALSLGKANVTEVVATSVPEMSTWAMMFAGFAGLGLVGFGRNKKARAVEA